MNKFLRPAFFWDTGYKALEKAIEEDRISKSNLRDYNYIETIPGLKAVNYQGNLLAVQRVDTEIEVKHCMLEPMRATDNNRVTFLFTECDDFDFFVW